MPPVDRGRKVWADPGPIIHLRWTARYTLYVLYLIIPPPGPELGYNKRVVTCNQLLRFHRKTFAVSCSVIRQAAFPVLGTPLVMATWHIPALSSLEPRHSPLICRRSQRRGKVFLYRLASDSEATWPGRSVIKLHRRRASSIERIQGIYESISLSLATQFHLQDVTTSI